MKLVAIRSSELPFGKAINAIAHASLGLAAKLRQAGQLDSVESNFAGTIGGFRLVNSAVAFEEAGSADILAARKKAHASKLAAVDFTETMTGDTYVEQLEKTKAVATDQLHYFAIVFAE
jgi:hypothetical protein